MGNIPHVCQPMIGKNNKLCHFPGYCAKNGCMNLEEYNKIPLQLRLLNEAALAGRTDLGPLED